MAETTSETGSFEQLLKLLGAQGLSNDEFLREALWLAQHIPAGWGQQPRRGSEGGRKPPSGDSGDGAKEHEGRGTPPPSQPPISPAPTGPQPGMDELDDGRLYPKVEPRKDAGRKASAIYVPASGALPQPLELARALRPFQEKFRSRRLTKLDIAATAELSAERREITPVLVRERERWFSLSLLVDNAPSMAVWRKTARELARFLGTLGIFRDVRSWAVDENLRLTARGGRQATPKQLADPTGRTLIVVLTNGVGRHWQSREMAKWLTDWARSGPVAICSLLPPIRWEHTDLGPAYLWARASAPGAGNRLLTAGEGRRTVQLQDGATVFPVFPLNRQGLEGWAAMQMSRRETKTPALPIAPSWFEPLKEIEASAGRVEDVAQRVAEFRSFASPDAARLLEFFSAIPLSLPVMRLVQYTMMPDSPLSAMAEVLMSGLVVPSRTTPEGADPESILFEFTPEARKYLRDRTSIGDLERIQHEVSGAVAEYIERRAGVSVADFEALVDDADGLKDLPPDVQYFAQVTAETLRALGYRKPRKPELPDDRPGVYVAWNVPDVEEWAQEIATGLKKRGIRVLTQGRDDLPAKGSILTVIKNLEVFDAAWLWRELTRLTESGLGGVTLIGPGVSPANDRFLYADRYSNRDEMLEAIIEEIGKRDVNPAPPPKGAPPLDRDRVVQMNPDFAKVQELMVKGTVVLFSNERFTPLPYVRDLVWTRENRLRFPGGIQWLRAGEQPEERPGQLLIFEAPQDPVKIPGVCSAVLLDPDVEAVLDLPDSTVSYEGSAEMIERETSEDAEELKKTLPGYVVEDMRHSAHLLELARDLIKDKDTWPMVRERFGQEWLRSRPGSVIGLEIHFLTTFFEAIEPALREAAGLRSALRDGADEEFIEIVIPLETRKALEKVGLVEGSIYEPVRVCRKLASMSRRWPGWNAKVLAATGVFERDWFGVVIRHPYARRHLIYHLLQAGNPTMIEQAVTRFDWWALRIEADGMEALANDLRSLPEHLESFRQIQAFLNSLSSLAEMNRGQMAAAISDSDLPLPQALRDSARAAMEPGARYQPSRFILLAGSRRSAPDQDIEDATLWAAEAIAREVAKRGLGLICGAEFGSDSAAIRGFLNQLTPKAAGPALQVVTYGDHPVPFAVPPGTKVLRGKDQVADSVSPADAVVVLGGNQWVRRVARAALEQGKRLFPVPGAGGAAERLFQEQANAGSDLKWAGRITTKEDAGQMARALLDDILGSGATVSPRDARLAEWCACRSRVIPLFVVKALGTSMVDEILAQERSIEFGGTDGVVVEENTHAAYHGRANPDVHRRISEAIEAFQAGDFSLRERLFHLIQAKQRDKAVSAATDLGWLIPAIELGDPTVLDDLLALGMTELVADLRASGKPIRARLAGSRNPEIARAAIRYQHASTYVEVAGSGSARLDQVTQRAAEAMGTALALGGFGLITGAWPGVDYVVAAMYLNGAGKSLVHVVTPASIERFGDALEVEVAEEDTAEKLADAVVVIGGLGGTMRSFLSARALGKPVFPYGPSGGDAQKAVGMLSPAEAGPLQTELSPEEFASFVIQKLGTSTGLERIWELAARYDTIRRTMRSGSERTGDMTKVFEEMLKEVPAAADHLVEFQRSPSAGRRLAAIAVLQSMPRREELDWLAERMDNPEAETPFIGFQAGVALLSAVRSLSPADCDLLERILDKARKLAEKLRNDEGRLRVLAIAELELMRKRSTRDEELDVTRLVQQELLQSGYHKSVLTRNLLIFRTKGQRTWITFTTAGVFCTLDNRPRGENFFRVQWFQLLGDIDPSSVITRDRPEQSGLLTMGARRNWLYSRQMFNSTTMKNAVLRELERAIEFGDRVKRYSLL